METNMSTILHHTFWEAATTDVLWIGQAIRRFWQALLRWRDEQAARAHLSAMSDRELRDIGLNRADIRFAVKGELDRSRRHSS
jgi:uncharacterized protein YjiS (DUF1127 family)